MRGSGNVERNEEEKKKELEGEIGKGRENNEGEWKWVDWGS